MNASQNYGRHLERFHPREDSKDRREYGQGKFSFGKSKVVENDEDVVEDEEEYHWRKEGVNENTFTGIDTAIEAVASKKRARRTDDKDLTVKGTVEDLHGVEKMVDKAIEELALITPNRHEKKIDSIKHKLDYILKKLKVSKTVEEFEKMVRDVKKITVSDSKVERSFVEKEDLFRVLVACKSVAELELKIPEN